MSGELTVLSALMLGFIGSGHCAGMCGGIAASLGAGTGAAHSSGRAGYALLFTVGRIGTYTAAGALVGLSAVAFGAALDMPAAGPVLRVATGLLMIAIGVSLVTGWQGLRRIEALGIPVWRRVSPWARRLLPVRSSGAALALGGLWGALPCGLVYTMLTAALLAGDPIGSAAIMLAFGLGTAPAMLGMSLAGQSLQPLLRRRPLRAVAGVLIVIFGAWTALSVMPDDGDAGHAAHHGHHHAAQ